MMLLKAFKYVMLIAVNLAALFAGISAAPLPNDFGQNYVVVKKPELHAAKDYLVKFQHIKKQTSDPVTDEELRQGLLNLQKFAGLDQTGELDTATQLLMATPRCGKPDKAHADGSTRYFTDSSLAWSTHQLTYHISSYPSKTLSNSDVSNLVQRAYKYWTDASNLTITAASSSTAPLQVNFYSYDHGDGYSFDGPGGVLGHTWGSPWGMIHFDNSESWTNGSTAGINFLQVATHELGHSLGMEHTGVATAVMFPYYMGYKADFKLDPDDVAGIQSLYGTPKASRSADEIWKLFDRLLDDVERN